MIAKVAKRLVWSHHMEESFGKKVSIALPITAEEKPNVLRFTENGVQFVDGSSEAFSHVVFATGYDYKFPFLSIDCGLSCNEKFVQPLWKHCISITRPTLAIIGIPYFATAMPLFDLQVRFCLTFMTRKKKLPSMEEMLKDTEQDMNERRTRLKKHKLHFLGMEKHAEYYKDLSDVAEIEPLKPVIAKIFNKSFTNFFDNFNSFRSFNFKIIDDETYTIS
jgi:dimethylaniline monooxygenase (N-oxide forming)